MPKLVGKDERLVKIFETGLQLFSKYGYKKTTLDDIADELKMVKGNLYLYVKNKKDLYEKSIEHALIHWQERVVESMSGIESIPERFEVMCFSAYRYLRDTPDLRRIAAQDPDIFSIYPAHLKDRFQDVNQASIGMIRELLVKGVETGVFREMDIESTVKFIFSVYNMFIIKTYVESEGEEVEKMFAASIDLMVNGLKK